MNVHSADNFIVLLIFLLIFVVVYVGKSSKGPFQRQTIIPGFLS